MLATRSSVSNGLPSSPDIFVSINPTLDNALPDVQFRGMSLCSRIQWENKEEQFLAPYATFSFNSLGRAHPEEVHIFKSEYQRDRDRVVHCPSFRRLEYKTHIAQQNSTDLFRTRLAHSIEVATISRTIARTLSLNEDLTEAIALAHDLGHPPFGHSGEHTLNQLMADHGGFRHNGQSRRVVEQLENKYPEFNGLNLSWEVREGIDPIQTKKGKLQPSLEAQIVDLADEIAYCCHDLDDAMQHHMILPEQLKDIELWHEIDARIKKSYSKLDPERHRLYAVRLLLEELVEDVCRQSAQNISQANPKDLCQVQKMDKRCIGSSIKIRSQVQNLRDFVIQHFYYHKRVTRFAQRSCWVLQTLFEFYHKHPQLIPSRFSVRLKKEGLSKCTCDYLASMTDREALQAYTRHIGTDDLLKELLPQNA